MQGRAVEASAFRPGRIPPDFTLTDEAEYRKEIDRVLREVDVAVELGVPLMRHDVAWKARQAGEEAGLAGRLWSMQAISIERFEESLPRMAAGCAEIADYANLFGITTMIENYLYFVQASDRVQVNSSRGPTELPDDAAHWQLSLCG